MTKLFFNLGIAVTLSAIVWCEATDPVEQCNDVHYEDLQNRITVNPCGSKKCKLAKLTNTTVAFRFMPMQEVKNLTNDVNAKIAGVPLELPFLGVTGQNACGNIYRADTGDRAPCPLEPGIEYIYENKFFIESFYPTVDLRVHWSLNDGDRKVICFEVPAVIVNGKNKTKSRKDR